MPELPDVEVFKQYLDATSLHQTIEEVHTDKIEDMLADVRRAGMTRKLKGSQFTGTKRHGKFLFVATDQNGWLLLHFGMTGFLKYFKNTGQKPDHLRLQVNFTNNYTLVVGSQRRLGRIGIVDDPDAFVREKELGPDARNDLSFEAFQQIVQQGRGKMKSFLMNQNRIAGIGNIYSDEILFQSGLHPGTEVRAMKQRPGTIRRLYDAITEVLDKSISAGASPEEMPRDFLLPNRQKGGSCPACGNPISAEKFAGRISYFCRNCQKSKN